MGSLESHLPIGELPSTAAMEPFYFGHRDAALFGLYHAPARGTAERSGVVLCAPFGHEFIVAHRAYRELALRLAAAGFHVLRFDYHATGDSAGACDAGAPGRWVDDIASAIGELRLRMGRCSIVALVGARLGATLTTLVAAERGDIARLVLWDPVINGRTHLVELGRRQEAMLRRTHVTPATSPSHTREFLGFALAESACREVEALDLLAIVEPPAREVLVVRSTGDHGVEALVRRLRTLGCGVECAHEPVARAWTWIEDGAAILVPVNVVTRIASWIALPTP
jgi:uncharacterized protein